MCGKLPKNRDSDIYASSRRGDLVYIHRLYASRGISGIFWAERIKHAAECQCQSHNPSHTWFPDGDPNHVHPHEKLREGNRGKESNDALPLECQCIQTVKEISSLISVPATGETCRIIKDTCARSVHKKNDKI